MAPTCIYNFGTGVEISERLGSTESLAAGQTVAPAGIDEPGARHDLIGAPGPTQEQETGFMRVRDRGASGIRRSGRIASTACSTASGRRNPIRY